MARDSRLQDNGPALVSKAVIEAEKKGHGGATVKRLNTAQKQQLRRHSIDSDGVTSTAAVAVATRIAI